MSGVITTDMIDLRLPFYGIQCLVRDYKNKGAYHNQTFWVPSEGPPRRQFEEFVPTALAGCKRSFGEFLCQPEIPDFRWTNRYPEISGVPCVPPQKNPDDLETMMKEPKCPNDQLLGFVKNGDRWDPVLKQIDEQVIEIILGSDGAAPRGMVLQFGYMSEYYLEIDATYLPITTLIQIMEASGIEFDKINEKTVIGVVGVPPERRHELQSYMSRKAQFPNLQYS